MESCFQDGACSVCFLLQPHLLNGHAFEQTLGDSKGQRSQVCCSLWGHKESDTTYRLNNGNKDSGEAKVLQEGGPLPGPETGLLSNTRKWIVWGDTCWQSKRFYWERAPGWRAVGKGTQENCSAAWLTVFGFMVMGLVFRWSLANHSNSESFLVAYALLSQDGC